MVDFFYWKNERPAFRTRASLFVVGEGGLSGTAAAASSRESTAVFPASVMAGVAGVASSIAGFVGVEMGEGPIATLGDGSSITVVRIPAVIDVAVEPTRTVEPGSGSNEKTAREPVGAIVAVWCAVVGSVIEVSVRADGRRSDIDGNLGGCCGHAAHQCDGESRES